MNPEDHPIAVLRDVRAALAEFSRQGGRNAVREFALTLAHAHVKPGLLGRVQRAIDLLEENGMGLTSVAEGKR